MRCRVLAARVDADASLNERVDRHCVLLNLAILPLNAVVMLYLVGEYGPNDLSCLLQQHRAPSLRPIRVVNADE